MLVVTADVDNSVVHSVSLATSLTGRADVEVVAFDSGGLDPGLVDQLEHIRGARAVAPTVRTRVHANGVATALFGVDARALAIDHGLRDDLAGTADLAEEGPGALLDGVFVGSGLARLAGLREGSRLRVRSADGRSRSIRILGVVDHGPLVLVDEGVFIVGLLKVTQDLSGRPGRVDALDFRAAPGRSPTQLFRRVDAAVHGRALVTSPRDRAAQVTDFLTPVRAVMLFVDGLALLGAGFLVLDASALTLLERRRSLALLRALGARRRVIAIGLFGETALVGLVSAALGWLVGGVGARLVVAAIPSVVEGEFRFRFGFFAP